jgi:hypothetical protein
MLAWFNDFSTQCLAADLPTLVADFVPKSLSHFMCSLNVLPTQCNDLTDNQLSNAPRVAERTVEYGDSAFGSILQVNLVRTNAKASNADKVLGMLEDILGQLGFGTNADSLYITDLFYQLVFG